MKASLNMTPDKLALYFFLSVLIVGLLMLVGLVFTGGVLG